MALSKQSFQFENLVFTNQRAKKIEFMKQVTKKTSRTNIEGPDNPGVFRRPQEQQASGLSAW